MLRGFDQPGGPGPAARVAGAVRGAEASLAAAPGAPRREDTAAAAPPPASLVPVPTLRRLRRLRNGERGQRRLPLLPPPLPNAEPERGRLPRQIVRLRSCERFSERAPEGDACARTRVRVCERVRRAAETVRPGLSGTCRESSMRR